MRAAILRAQSDSIPVIAARKERERYGGLVPYEVRAKTGESVFSVVVETAKQALAKMDELLKLAHVDDVSVRDWAGKIMDLGALEAEAAEA